MQFLCSLLVRGLIKQRAMSSSTLGTNYTIAAELKDFETNMDYIYTYHL